ncbi:preprotein translocase subunit TatB [Afipia sp. P52-10]|uniref:Sec-independent protein translocase protein TatB n=1 Tax=Afipia sp. P52-10 TaxID=1429916 RepID=UPI0003DF34ED|nr:Sec-independent protein translocase protein TatB [Afipia sp. P52-10]ETR75250.1 preprotein translocase subunit TatB [Afipia sp. P52-10]
MFDIGWSELVVIGVVALIAIGPKELPGVLRMVGQWMGKARRMAAEFQNQFQEAMREAEIADMKKQFDEVTAAAGNLASNNVLTSTVKDVEEALKLDTSAVATPTPPEPPTPETFKEAIVHAATAELASPAPAVETPASETSASADAAPLQPADKPT